VPVKVPILDDVYRLHGGDKDCIITGKGNSLNLTEQVKSLIFRVIDLQTVMGDGEIVGRSGLKPLFTRVSVKILKPSA